MARSWIFLAALLSLSLRAQDFSKLPDWARPHAEAAKAETAPDADAWVLLDRTEVAYAGDGEVRTHRYRLVKVLGERGLEAGTFVLSGLGGNTSKVKKLKGWNLRPDGEVEKLDRDYTFSVSSAGGEDFSTQTFSGGVLTRVVKGSLVAFESLQVVRHPVGPVEEAYLMEGSPVRRWELEVGKKEGWFTNLKQVEVHLDLHHFQPWIPVSEKEEGRRVAASNLPALPKDEGVHPNARNLLPWVSVRFLDPELKGASGWGSWDAHAAWMEGLFKEKALPAGVAVKSTDAKAALEGVSAWMRKELSYKQVYLTPDRGWTPELSTEVVRRHYGDCKDLACLLIAEAKSLGLGAYPALAHIGGGVIEADEPPYLVFDHAIAAIKLDHSWGLPAEVETPGGRFLLVDPTDRFTPLGQLGAHHRGGRVLICASGKGLWASVPDSALLAPRTRLEIEGSCADSGRLDSTLTIHEQGDAWSLRSIALLQGAAKLKDHIIRDVVDLPPTGELEILSQGDPLDVSHPFEVRAKVVHPEGIKASGGEFQVPTWGIKIVPPVAQKPGQARVFPVEARGFESISYHASLRFPRQLKPELPALDLQTARRNLHWQATTQAEGAGCRVELSMEEKSSDAIYGFADRVKGVADLKLDRSSVKNFLSDAFSFKPLP